MSDDYLECPGCDKRLKRTTTKPEKYRKHDTPGKEPCDFGGTVIPQEEECSMENAESLTASSAPSPTGDATDPAGPATSTTPSGQPSPEPEGDASTSATASPVIPGISSYVSTLGDMAATQLAECKARVEANLTPFSQPAPVEVDQPPLFSQPAGRRSEAPPLPMTAEAGELAARLKELFYAYDNRRSTDNRSAQATMGPSEMGTPCDRRLALSLMRMPPVNPGGDGWAAFVGTCIHAGLEQMFMWADAGTGRFAVEQRLEFPSDIVPKGTADLIDRTLFMLDDHKCQGRWSRNKLRTQGPSPTYRTQAHVYAYGARLKGEKIEKIAIISWPRDEATLDDLYVHVEDYNPAIAKAAFERVEEIKLDVDRRLNMVDPTLEDKARVAAEFNVADDCRFCKYHMPGARSITQGCNGKR
jgi:hypothetical protein